MPDLLLELFSEEIPARMQRKAAGDLRKLVTDALVDAGLTYEGAREHWTPRRLALDIRGVTARSADIREEKKGPRNDAPRKPSTVFCVRPALPRSRRPRSSRPQEGRVLRRDNRKARPRRQGDHRRGDAEDHPRFSVAEIDALGRGLRARLTRQFALGASAAFDPVPVRPGDRGERGRRLRSRGHPLRQSHARPPFPRAGGDHGPPLRRLYVASLGKGLGHSRCRATQAHHSR